MANKHNTKKYKYTAVDTENRKTTGIMLANCEAELRQMLISAGLYLTKCKVISDKAVTFFSLQSKIKAAEIAAFAREFSIMLGAGITIVEALDTLRFQPYSKLMRRILDMAYNDVRSGLLLSQALGKHQKIFSELLVSMIYVGEMSGTLDKILSELASYYERDYKIKRKATSALVYPAVLTALTLGVLILLVAVIIPTFKTTLLRLDVEMPRLTLFVLKISDFFNANLLIITLSLVAFILVVAMLFRLQAVKYAWDTVKAKAPILRRVTASLVASKFSRGFSVLISKGVDVVKALEIMSKVIGNRYYQKKYLAALTQIKQGRSIADAFLDNKVFPEILLQMIATGEKTGSLDTVIYGSATYFDEQVEASLTRMTSLIEPIIICAIGGIIAVVILSVFSPLMSIISALGV